MHYLDSLKYNLRDLSYASTVPINFLVENLRICLIFCLTACFDHFKVYPNF